MRKRNGLHKHVTTCVDDMCAVTHDSMKVINQLKKNTWIQTKGNWSNGSPSGMWPQERFRWQACNRPWKHMDKIMVGHKQMIGLLSKRHKKQSSLESDDHTEVDTSEFLDNDKTEKHQLASGSLKWLSSIGRFNTQAQVMTPCSLRVQPCTGRLERVKQANAPVCLQHVTSLH